MKDKEFNFLLRREVLALNISEDFLLLYRDYGLKGVIQGFKDALLALWYNRRIAKKEPPHDPI